MAAPTIDLILALIPVAAVVLFVMWRVIVVLSRTLEPPGSPRAAGTDTRRPGGGERHA
jgi:hypothetical protein